MDTHPPYGLLLTFDGYGASPVACGDEATLLKILYELPPAIGMRPLGEPHTVYIDEPGIRGYSGFTFIMESHISIHTYIERGFVTADIYSCKTFDTALAARYLADAFSPSAFDTETLIRGRDFHRLSHTPLPPTPHMRR